VTTTLYAQAGEKEVRKKWKKLQPSGNIEGCNLSWF
jgi:hypothetical protein